MPKITKTLAVQLRPEELNEILARYYGEYPDEAGVDSGTVVGTEVDFMGGNTRPDPDENSKPMIGPDGFEVPLGYKIFETDEDGNHVLDAAGDKVWTGEYTEPVERKAKIYKIVVHVQNVL